MTEQNQTENPRKQVKVSPLEVLGKMVKNLELKEKAKECGDYFRGFALEQLGSFTGPRTINYFPQSGLNGSAASGLGYALGVLTGIVTDAAIVTGTVASFFTSPESYPNLSATAMACRNVALTKVGTQIAGVITRKYIDSYTTAKRQLIEEKLGETQ